MHIKALFVSFVVLLLLFFQSNDLRAQEEQYVPYSIGFYNVENLFDTDDDPLINDEEFLPTGKKAWTAEKYEEKIASVASVISQMGKGLCPDGLSLLGVSEIENASVLEDLVSHPLLARRNYGFIHRDSRDKRGIDVAMIYDIDQFEPIDVKMYKVDLSEGDTSVYSRPTRDVLFITGMLEDEKIHVTVNHWPSRSGGEARTASKRNIAARVNRSILDSLQVEDPNARLIIMGDMNDNPNNESLTKYLSSKKKEKKVSHSDVYNPLHHMFDKGIGTTAYRDSWSLFDQIVVSPGLLKKNDAQFFLEKGVIYKKGYLLQNKGKYKGYPKRTFDGDVFQSGYSDHLPVFIYLLKEAS